ncbi:molybdenum cofactor synthesis domain-containing protein [Muricomes intestini]|uniref:Molybdenum cofactor synthesis domain-containing protein n=3 Tax=Muricomes intestini TaxID=1796634 RepID=A0A4R3K1Y7_9FIRM|nr:molybdenum cofactor synthesis domain-containing protein [Muricomes intestini]
MVIIAMKKRWKTAIITLSDKGYAGEREDKSGPLILEMIEEAGYEAAEVVLLPDEQQMIEEKLIELCDKKHMDLILTTGGTGFSPRDCTPEATLAVATRNAPGIAEAMRYASLQITPRAMLSRAASVIRNQTLIVNLPGSPKAVKENLECIIQSLPHGLEIMKGMTGECGRERSIQSKN